MTKLPMHLTEPVDKTSPYWDGMYVRRHPNVIRDSERSVSIVLAAIAVAVKALNAYKLHSKQTTRAEDLKIAFEALDDITWHFPQTLMLPCCWTEYLPGKDGKRWSETEVVWSAHLTQADADRWISAWREKFKDRNDYGWHCGPHVCAVTDIVDPDGKVDVG